MSHAYQTKRQIRTLLEAAGLRPRKRFGQNFLIDGNLMRRLVDAAELSRDDVVLEVGAGTGSLTAALAERAGRVIAIEVDKDLYGRLDAQFADVAEVRLIRADALESKNRLSPHLVDAVESSAQAFSGRCVLVANLPYQIATPLIGNILLDVPRIRRLCFTVQLEVGERFAAAAGTPAFGPISVLAQMTCDIQVLGRVPPDAFWPAPKVESVMLRLDVKERPSGADEAPVTLRAMTEFVRGLFEHRRKTLRAGLRLAGYDPGRLSEPAVDLDRRAESLLIPEWIALWRQVSLTHGRG